MAQRSESRVKISCTLPSKQAIMKQRLIMAEQSHTLWYFLLFYKVYFIKITAFYVSVLNKFLSLRQSGRHKQQNGETLFCY